MSIEILPARLANQIAAGEVVERPASVVKELLENSLDAGATKLHIDIEKGGSKRIRIIDNGCGIAKDELCLALSRHATSKIKSLDDLESIASLGFRGEALASISSVARLMLTSKPKNQATAWQACAEGRDMSVKLQPAAHPDGTTIEVQDLFFNTPARRKFLRTEKTEFAHIDEVIRRIALARFDVAITLTHNGKTVRQYPALQQKEYYVKRVGKICGQKFIDHAVTISSEHDGLTLWGWVADANFYRHQNDLSYSYVNGRMMRDKLINHAIRQAYADSLPNDVYPAFVLYFQLDHREVDVNVHPAKHEVRFHQGRYVHDFIYSVIHQALSSISSTQSREKQDDSINRELTTEKYYSKAVENQQSYITPLRHIKDKASHYQLTANIGSKQSLKKASESYQHLLTTPNFNPEETPCSSTAVKPTQAAYQVLTIYQDHYAVVNYQENQLQQLRLLSLKPLVIKVEQQKLQSRWLSGLTSQPLLLPQRLEYTIAEITWLKSQQELMEQAGIHYIIKDNTHLQVRQFPACLRQHNVADALTKLINNLMPLSNQSPLTGDDYCLALAKLLATHPFTPESAQNLLDSLQIQQIDEFKKQLALNSVEVDLTSLLSKLN